MDLNFTVEEEEFREEVREWIGENVPKVFKLGRGRNTRADRDLWYGRLAEKGWLCHSWPEDAGGPGWSLAKQFIFKDEASKSGAPHGDMGVTMIGPLLIQYGTPEQKERYLPKITAAEEMWCQGYSEPNAGSDLASLACKAEDKGDHWLVNGQKTWTSGADQAQWIGCLVRTDPSAPKRDGISFLILDMDQPGIETRPIQLIGGASPFCETFFNDAVTDKDEILGELNAGWTVGKRLLQHERQSQTNAGGGMGGSSRLSLQELADRYVGRDEQGRIDDADLRARIAEHLMQAQAQRLTVKRITAEARGNAKVSAAASILKNAASSITQTRSELALEIMGNSGLGWEGDSFEVHELEAVRGWLGAKAVSIYGGSYEVQNNIIAKNILGLPENTQRG